MKEPKIRFKGFQGEWEEKALGCCVAFWDSMRQPIEEVKRIKGIYPYYGASGVVDYINDYIFDEELILLSEDGANITDRNYPVCFIARGKYWVNNHAHVLKANKGFDNVFLCNNLERKDYTQYNTGMAMPKLNKEVCIRIPVFYPILPEQQSIASYFQHLDSLIQSTTKKIESLKQVKAASLQSMFPQEGETTPRVRFKGFEGEWEKVKFGEVAKIRRGLTYSPFNLRDKGIRVLRSSNIDEDTFVISENDVFVNKECINIEYAEEGDILVTAANGSPRLVGKHAIINNIGTNTMVVGGFMLLISSNESTFLNASMSSSWYSQFLKVGVAGGNGAIGNLNKQDLEDCELLIPNKKEERNHIASYFTTLDRQISLQTQRLEKLKQIKAACLDNMFV